MLDLKRFLLDVEDMNRTELLAKISQLEQVNLQMSLKKARINEVTVFTNHRSVK